MNHNIESLETAGDEPLDFAAVRARIGAPAASAALQPPSEDCSSSCDKYRAELYDEVWQKARELGYANVTMALSAVTEMKLIDQAAAGDAALEDAAQYFERSRPGDPGKIIAAELRALKCEGAP